MENELIKEIIEGGKKAKKKGNSYAVLIVIIIIVLVVVGLFLWAFFVIKKNKKELQENWQEYRCKMPYMFLVSSFAPVDTTTNFAECTKQWLEPIIDNKNSSNLNKMNVINKNLEKLQNDNMNFRKIIYHIRMSVENQVRAIITKVHNLYKRLAYLFKTFLRLIFKVFLVFKNVFNLTKYAFLTMISMWIGPIGGLVRAFCFTSNTLLKTYKNYLKKIHEVELGEYLTDKSFVIGKCQFLNEGQIFYEINGIQVADSHLIEHEGQMIRVKDYHDKKEIINNEPFIYNLITSDNKIIIKNKIFGDYLCDNLLSSYKKMFNTCLENKFTNNEIFGINLDYYEDKALNLYPGFTFDSLIHDGKRMRRIKELEPGDKIQGQKIIGVVHYQLYGKTFVLKTQSQKLNATMIGIQIFEKDGKYYAPELEEIFILGKLNCVGLIMENNIVPILDNLRIADFDIVPNKKKIEMEKELWG